MTLFLLKKTSKFELKGAFLLDDAPWPERGLFADVNSPVGLLTISNFHVPNASNHGDVKTNSFLALAHWLAGRPERMIVGIDTNSLKIDHPDLGQSYWYYPEVEPKMLGPKPLHALKNAFRVWLEANPREAEELYTNRPQGPLADTYYQVRGNIGDPDRTENAYRYDYIYISSDLSVAQINHVYNGDPQAFKHAAVVADLVFAPEENR